MAVVGVLGPPFSGFLFDRHPSWPYVACGVLVFVTGMYFAIKWHYDREKQQADRRVLLRASWFLIST